jgi:uncharacterized membrane protein
VTNWLFGGTLSDAGELAWSAPDWLVWAVLLACGLAVLIAAIPPAASRRSLGAHFGSVALWAVAVAVLGAAALGPQWVEGDGRLESGPLVVLVDGSASMAVIEGGGSRSDGVGPVLESLMDRASSGGPVEVYTFDEGLRAGPPRSFAGRGTDLGVALDAVVDRYLGQELRGVVVITDGLDRGTLRRDLREAAKNGVIDPAMAPVLPGPLTIYQIGRLEDVHDVAVVDVVSGGFAFLRTPFSLTAKVRGPAGRSLPVSLIHEGRVVRQETVELDEQGVGEVVFEITPRQVGRFAWQVSVPVDPDDAVPGNNMFPVVVRVVRDRTRVLQVSGSPSYDQKALRLFLKEDPSVDLVSFFILRTQSDLSAGWPSWELSLIEFPYERLFTDGLDGFDLVILQNFNYEPYFSFNSEELLENLAEYVENGGALVMTGGDRSFDLGAYEGTPLARVLPVRLGVAGRKSDEVPFRPALTDAGMVHPITRIAADLDQSRATWERLPPMDGLNLTVGAAEGAAVLAEHPTLLGANGKPAPVLAVRDAGAGRTMALTVDASWRWSFSEAALGRGNQAYLRFWKNSMRWLVADPDDRRVVVTPSRDNVFLGDEVRLSTLVRDSGHGPVVGVTVEGEIHAPGGEATPFVAETDASGEAVMTFRPSGAGAHRVQVRLAGDVRQSGESVFAVSTRDPELAEVVPDRAFLRDLAALFGERGLWRAPGDTSAPLMDATAQRLIPASHEVDLATAPLVAVLFGIFAGLAWWLRRRAGGR